MSEQEKALTYAKVHGYNAAEHLCKWNGYEVFNLMPDSGCIGLPQVLLVSEKSLRMATEKEVENILGWDDNSEYDDED